MLWVIAIVIIVLVILITVEGGGSILVDWITWTVKRKSKNWCVRKYADVVVGFLFFVLLVLLALLWKS